MADKLKKPVGRHIFCLVLLRKEITSCLPIQVFQKVAFVSKSHGVVIVSVLWNAQKCRRRTPLWCEAWMPRTQELDERSTNSTFLTHWKGSTMLLTKVKGDFVHIPECFARNEYFWTFSFSSICYLFCFSAEGRLRNTEDGEPFVFKLKEDHQYNQKRYEALGEVCCVLSCKKNLCFWDVGSLCGNGMFSYCPPPPLWESNDAVALFDAKQLFGDLSSSVLERVGASTCQFVCFLKIVCDCCTYVFLFQIINEHVYELLEKEVHLKRVYLPVSGLYEGGVD